jgi:hypothetical protein
MKRSGLQDMLHAELVDMIQANDSRVDKAGCPNKKYTSCELRPRA